MSDEVKLRIQQAAKRLFAKQGYAGTSVRQICEEAGANVALVSYYFGGKEKLLLSIFEQFFQISERVARVESSADPVERMKRFIREFMEHMSTDADTALLVHHELVLQTERLADVHGFIYPVWSRVRQVLEDGREQGKFHFQSLDQALMHVAGTLLFSILNHAVSPLLNEQQQDFDLIVAERTRYILGGLGVHPIE
jgi:TetR/AcrR family transcriptional regulator, upper aerobic nicotinate degradation pathway regulator